jgi:hypoxanthine phosphoribosyltransferase
MQEKSVLSWTDVINDCYKAANNWTVSRKLKPDAICAVARGGLIPAAIIASYLDVKRVISVQVSSYEGEQRFDCDALISLASHGELHQGSLVLVVDDLCDSGKTFSQIRNEMLPWISDGRIYLHYIALYNKQILGREDYFSLDGFAQTMAHDKWIVFPWETVPEHHITSLVRQFNPQPTIAEVLAKHHADKGTIIGGRG